MSLLEFSGRLLTALLLGTLIGVERQWHKRLADLKVTALVCIGATLFTASFAYFGRQGEDPTRMAAQVVVGVGFLGAGLLWRDGGEVRGITTAATLWCSAAVGVFVGVGAYREAAVATALIVLGNTLLRPIGHRLNLRMGPADGARPTRRVVLECAAETIPIDEIVATLVAGSGIELTSRADGVLADGARVTTLSLALESGDAEQQLDAAIATVRETQLGRGLRRLELTRVS